MPVRIRIGHTVKVGICPNQTPEIGARDRHLSQIDVPRTIFDVVRRTGTTIRYGAAIRYRQTSSRGRVVVAFAACYNQIDVCVTLCIKTGAQFGQFIAHMWISN